MSGDGTPHPAARSGRACAAAAAGASPSAIPVAPPPSANGLRTARALVVLNVGELASNGLGKLLGSIVSLQCSRQVRSPCAPR